MANYSSPKSSLLFLLIIMFFILFANSFSSAKSHQPCKELVLYFHDIIFNGNNVDNATSAIVAAPQGSNLTTLAPQQFHFGDIVVFDDPVTLDNNLHSTPVGRTQGIYIYNGINIFSAWFSFTFALNSTDYKGTISFVGVDPLFQKTRDISIVGGTGDFFMHRGVATMVTGTVQGDAYFSIQLHIKFYECW